jgi:hypothetical protein
MGEEQPKSRLEENLESGGGWLLPVVRLGVSTSAGVPRLTAYSVDTRLLKYFGASFSYSPMLETDYFGELARIGIGGWNVTGRLFPTAESFFLGLSYGGQTLTASRTDTYTTTVGEQTVSMPLKATLTVATTTLTPHFGWFATWDWGFSLGTEFGVQFALETESRFSLEPTGETSSEPEQAAVDALEQEERVQKTRRDIEDFGTSVGKQAIPFWNILRIGWML